MCRVCKLENEMVVLMLKTWSRHLIDKLRCNTLTETSWQLLLRRRNIIIVVTESTNTSKINMRP